MQYDLGRVVIKKAHHLPHWYVEHGIYFVTWHLADALPAAARERIRNECDAYLELLRSRGGGALAAELELVRRFRRKLVNRTLDQCLGSCVLRGEPAAIVANAIRFFDANRYELFAWSVMPNHAHAVFSANDGCSLDGIMHSWKSYTSNKVNELLGRAGILWEREYLDSTMRNDRQLQRTIAYVVSNPVKAELFDWPFVESYPERIARAIG